MLTITRQQAREIDRRASEEFGIAGVVLMENAGRGVADTLCALGIDGPVAIYCGGGNNGGDGFVVARHLELRGYSVQVFLLSDPEKLTGDALTNYRIAMRSGITVTNRMASLEALSDCAYIVDALLGTGATGEPRAPFGAAIERINASGKSIVAIDVPSGLDCDTGLAARHTIRAAHTCTFVAQKQGFLLPGVEQYTGQVHVLDIGAPRKLIEVVLQRSSE